MKVLIINGSPHLHGTTFRALTEVAGTLNKEGIETEIFQLGAKPIRGCIACGRCKSSGTNRCIFTDDACNEIAEKIIEADALIIGSPVYFAGMTGQLKSLLDRLYSCLDSLNEENPYQYKPAAAVVCCRRGGATATFEQINKFFTIAGMPVVSSHYWNQVHGEGFEQAEQDEEGLQVMRSLGRNMAWLLKCIQAGRENGILPPVRETRAETSFVR